MTTTSSDLLKSVMNRLRVIDLKAKAKLRGLREYSKLRKAELIDFLKQSERKYTKNQSADSLLDATIPLNEIPQNSTILRPTKAKKIEKAVEWGKKEVENWGEWLKEMDSVENTRKKVCLSKIRNTV